MDFWWCLRERRSPHTRCLPSAGARFACHPPHPGNVVTEVVEGNHYFPPRYLPLLLSIPPLVGEGWGEGKRSILFDTLNLALHFV